MRFCRLVVAGVSALVALTACTTSSSPTPSTSNGASVSSSPSAGFTNPVFAANFPDPQIIATGSGYLAIATNGNGMNVQVLTSPDMVTWKQGADALPKIASWSTTGKVWAPEIHKWTDGTWRLYYTTMAPDPQWQCISVATADKPEGPYTDSSTEPLVCETAEGGSIDQSPFVDSSGKAWLYWKNDGNAIGVDTYIKVAPLSADGRSVTGKVTNLFKQDLPWEGHLVEGPAVVEIDGVYHMFYSANDYGSADYAVGHATASSPTGPFTKDPDPVLKSNDVAAGPGHCQLLEVHGTWWMVYHAWAPDAVGDELTGRQMWLSTVSFDGSKVTVQPPTVNQPAKP